MNKRTNVYVGVGETSAGVDSHIQAMNTEGYKLVSVTVVSSSDNLSRSPAIGSRYDFFWEKFILTEHEPVGRFHDRVMNVKDLDPSKFYNPGVWRHEDDSSTDES